MALRLPHARGGASPSHIPDMMPPSPSHRPDMAPCLPTYLTWCLTFLMPDMAPCFPHAPDMVPRPPHTPDMALLIPTPDTVPHLSTYLTWHLTFLAPDAATHLTRCLAFPHTCHGASPSHIPDVAPHLPTYLTWRLAFLTPLGMWREPGCQLAPELRGFKGAVGKRRLWKAQGLFWEAGRRDLQTLGRRERGE